MKSMADSLKASVQEPEALRLINAFATAHDEMATKYADALASFGATGGSRPAAADAQVRGVDRAPTALVDSIVAKLNEGVATRSDEIHDRVATQRIVLQGLVAVVVIAIL